MEKFTTSVTIGRADYAGHSVVVIIKPGSGSVLLEIDCGDGSWQVMDNYTSGANFDLNLGPADFRFTPTGGAALFVGGV